MIGSRAHPLVGITLKSDIDDRAQSSTNETERVLTWTLEAQVSDLNILLVVRDNRSFRSRVLWIGSVV